jgi:crotonobetainyl-CoA:carnitine CoA-transferase CaiB-like acyl-CoA transferase
MTVDLTREKGRELIYRLAEFSDVFVHNFRQGVPEKLKMDYDTLSRFNPKLIYAALSGYGPKGPEAHEPAFDYLGLARSGIMLLAGEPDMPPMNIRRGIADQMGAIMAGYGILAALVARERYGIGQKLDVSHLGSMMALEGEALGMLLYGSDTPRTDRTKAPNPLWNHYECKDGTWIVLAMLQPDRQWPALCKALGIDHLERDSRFATMDKRRENCQEIISILNEIFPAKTARQWHKILKAAGDIICTPVQTIYDLETDPQLLENEYIIECNHEVVGPVKVPGIPVKLSKTPGKVKCEAPEFGQHTEQVLIDIGGYTWEDITRFKDEGII